MIPRALITNILLTILSVDAVADESQLIEPVRPFVRTVVASLDSLPADRRQMLTTVADYVAQRVAAGEKSELVFICTHNSRRSHLSQVWCQTAAAYFHVPGVETYSGGTETTACNIRTVRAMRRAGLSIVASTAGDNPIYLIQYSETRPSLRAFSKIYSDAGNPTSHFAAMMCCASADRECPVVKGADARFQLHYEDPKIADNTLAEANAYDERSLQIAQEMFFVMSEVSRKISAVPKQ